MAQPSPCCLEYSRQMVFERDKLIAALKEERRMRKILVELKISELKLQARLSGADSTAEQLNAVQLSEARYCQEFLGTEDEPGTRGVEEKERVKAGLGSPTTKKADMEEMTNLTGFLEELFGAVMTTRDSSDPDRMLNTVFQLLPSRKRYPEYYELIKEPMDLKMCAEKIQKNKYKDICELEKDLQLLFTNAQTFNESGSQIYKDADILSKVVKSKAADCMTALAGRQSRGGGQVFSAAVAATKYDSDKDHYKKEAYHNYYEIISEPIDMNIIENKNNHFKSEDETGEGFSTHKVETVCKSHEVENVEIEAEDALEHGDSIFQLDGAADPVSCNICHRLFEGKNKGIKLTTHKINAHFKDDFRRAVKDETKLDGFFHCIEENCTAKFKQMTDLFRHLASVHKYLDRFTAATRSLSVPASIAPAPGPEQIPDLHTKPGSSHQQEQGTRRDPQSLAATSSAETNQGIKSDGVFYINLCPSFYSEFAPAAVVHCDEDGAIMLSDTSSSDILLDCHVRDGVCIAGPHDKTVIK